MKNSDAARTVSGHVYKSVAEMWASPLFDRFSDNDRVICIISALCGVEAQANGAMDGGAIFGLHFGLMMAAVEPSLAGTILEHLATHGGDIDAGMRDSLREVVDRWEASR